MRRLIEFNEILKKHAALYLSRTVEKMKPAIDILRRVGVESFPTARFCTAKCTSTRLNLTLILLPWSFSQL